MVAPSAGIGLRSMRITDVRQQARIARTRWRSTRRSFDHASSFCSPGRAPLR